MFGISINKMRVAEWCPSLLTKPEVLTSNPLVAFVKFFSYIIILVCNPTSDCERYKGAKDAYKRYPH